MRVKMSAFVCALTMTAPVSAAGVDAEDASGPQLMVVDYTTVDPADVVEFEAWFKDWVTAFQGAGLGPDYSWFTSSGPGFGYLWVSPVSDYAVLGAGEARQKEMTEALGAEKTAELFSKMQLMKTHRRELFRLRPDLSYSGPADADPTPGFLRINVHHVRPGMEERFEALIQTVVEAHTEVKHPHGWDAYRVEFGEGSYVFTAIAGSAAEFYGRPTTPQVLARALGEEDAGRLTTEWRECVSRFETRDARPRAELSFVAAPAGE